MIFSFVKVVNKDPKPITLKPTNIYRILVIMHVINVDSRLIIIAWRYLRNV